MDGLISTRRLSDLIGLIYDAAIDPARWPMAMEAIRAELDFHNSTLNLQLLPSGKVLTNVATNVPPRYLPMIDVAGADVLEQWGGPEVLLGLPMDQPAVLTRVNPRFDFSTTTNRYFLDFAKPQGIVDVMAIGLARSPQALGTLAFGRHERARPIGEREIGVAALLIPHLQRAATINRMLEGAALAQATLAAALDHISSPVLLVSTDMRIVYGNPVARRLLDRGEALRTVCGALVATSRAVNAALTVAVGQAARDHSRLGRRGLGIPVRGRDGASSALHVLPLRPAQAASDAPAVAAVFIARADTPFVAPGEVVAALFDLTPAEGRVFSLIAEGQTLARAARVLGVERSTAKTHLLRIYDKVGVRRQADLVRIAAALTAPIVA